MFSKTDRQTACQEQTIQQLRASLVAKSRMIDNMAYQIRTLSNAIIGFSELLLTEELTETQREFAQEIYQAGKGLTDIVNEVLDWARIERGRVQIARVLTKLSDILEPLRQLFEPLATSKNLTFEVDIDPDLPDSMMTDPDRLTKCLINLIANAVQYTQQGWVQVAVQKVKQGDEVFIRFAVMDSGPGIAPAKLATLFEPAQSEEDASARLLTSLGHRIVATVGLPLTQQLVEYLGGRLEAQSQVGCGSVFSIWLPLRQTVACDHTPSSSETGRSVCGSGVNAEQNDLPLLLVEDQPSNRLVVQLLLESLGCRVETAENGQQAVSMATANAYALILMDLKMPVMDGYEAARQLREKKIKTPIVALSAMEIDATYRQQMRQLFDDCLSKPIDGQQLAGLLKKYGIRCSAVVTQQV